MTRTIHVEFDPTDLPEWAQGIPEVVHIAECDLAFRVNLFRAKTADDAYATVLINEAKSRVHGRRDAEIY